MDVFIAILVLIAAGLLATTKPAYRIRRAKPVAALVAGGWLSVLAGVLLGPSVFGLIQRESIFQAVPLLALGLGWIGFMVGLQLRLSLLKSLPKVVYTTVAADALLTLIVMAPIVLVALYIWLPEPTAADLLIPTIFIVASSLGWSLESRSLGGISNERLALLIRAAGALAGVIAIVLFGLASKAVAQDAAGASHIAIDRAVLKVLHSAALAIAIGFIGRYMIRLAGSSHGHQLTVFLGIVAFIAGSAKQLDASPLITALGAGAVIANIDATGFRSFEAFIYRAEHTFAILFGLLAGLLMEPIFVPVMLAAALALVAVRAILKPFVLRRAALASGDESPAGEPLPEHSHVYLAAGRQSPLMLALAVSLILLEPSVFHKELLAFMVTVGVLSEIIPAIIVRTQHHEQDPPPSDGAAS